MSIIFSTSINPFSFNVFPVETKSTILELKFSFGEFLKDNEFTGRSTYRVYIYAFLILFSFGIGLGFLKNNSKESIQDKTVTINLLSLLIKIKKIVTKILLKKSKKIHQMN